MRWLGHASPADRDEWRQVEERDHCRDLVAEYDAIEPTRRAARNGARRAAALPAPVPSPAAPLLAAPLTLPTGWGWVLGKVARISRAAGFSHVVAYGPQSALGSLEVVSLRCGLSRPKRAVGNASPSESVCEWLSLQWDCRIGPSARRTRARSMRSGTSARAYTTITTFNRD